MVYKQTNFISQNKPVCVRPYKVERTDTITCICRTLQGFVNRRTRKCSIPLSGWHDISQLFCVEKEELFFSSCAGRTHFTALVWYCESCSNTVSSDWIYGVFVFPLELVGRTSNFEAEAERAYIVVRSWGWKRMTFNRWWCGSCFGTNINKNCWFLQLDRNVCLAITEPLLTLYKTCPCIQVNLHFCYLWNFKRS